MTTDPRYLEGKMTVGDLGRMTVHRAPADVADLLNRWLGSPRESAAAANWFAELAKALRVTS